MRVTGCNQCWYSPFIGGLPLQVWGMYETHFRCLHAILKLDKPSMITLNRCGLLWCATYLKKISIWLANLMYPIWSNAILMLNICKVSNVHPHTCNVIGLLPPMLLALSLAFLPFQTLFTHWLPLFNSIYLWVFPNCALVFSTRLHIFDMHDD